MWNKKTNRNILFAMCIFLLVMVCATATGQTIFVDAHATGANNGSSWEDAYNYLQDALADANSNPDVNEIWVAEGIYKPDQGGDQTPGDREDTFQLINGVAIYGGFPTGGSNWEDRDPNDPNNKTILSGDLNSDDIPSWPYNNGENSYHVVTGSGTNNKAVLDGFTITAGSDYRWDWDTDFPFEEPPLLIGFGGGMYNLGASPTVTNCTFSRNRVNGWGGGMYNDSSSPTVTNCTFSGNTADGGGFIGGYGGGMFNVNSSPTVTNCTFSGNSAGWRGGG